MGSSLSTKNSWDVVYILLPFGISAGLIVLILVCWWKCKVLVARNDPGDPEHFDFGHFINIQEYAENQAGTIVIYASPRASSVPIPYLFSTSGPFARIVALLPVPTLPVSSERSRITSLTTTNSALSTSRNVGTTTNDNDSSSNTNQPKRNSLESLELD